MKIFVKWMIFGCCVLVLQGANADQNTDIGRLKTILSQYKTVKGEFHQVRHLKEMQLALKSSGDFYFKMPLDLLWKQQKPFAMKIQMDSEKMVQTTLDSEPIKLTKAEQPVVFSFGSSFLGLFSGDMTSIERNFNYHTEFKGKTWKVLLQPKDEVLKKAILNVKIEGSKFIEKIEIEEISGNTTLIVFKNHIGV